MKCMFFSSECECKGLSLFSITSLLHHHHLATTSDSRRVRGSLVTLRENVSDVRVLLGFVEKLLGDEKADLTDEGVLSEGSGLLVKLDDSAVQAVLVGASEVLPRLHLNSDLLLKLRHVDLQSVDFLVPSGQLLVPLDPFVFDGLAVDSLLEPDVGHAAPRVEELAHVAAVHEVLGIGLDALLPPLALHEEEHLVEVDPLDEGLILQLHQAVDLVLDGIIPLLLLGDVLLFLADLRAYLGYVSFLVRHIGLIVLFILSQVGNLHLLILGHELLLELLEEAVVAFFET